MTTTEFFTYLLEHDASRDLAVDLADAYVGRLRIQRARAAAVARAAVPLATAPLTTAPLTTAIAS
ncbi:MAG TPA: hypothetical protein VF152_07945 [Acidimicrobiia bacterium]